MKPIVKISNLSFKFPDDPNHLFQNLELSINKKDCVLLVGPNGSGKSTLLHMIGRVLSKKFQDQVQENIKVNGNLSLVSQRASSQILSFRVDEELVTPLSFKKVKRSLRREKLTQLAEDYNLHDLLKRDPSNLSSGEQQLIVVLTTLQSNVDVILLDEPTAFLDDENAEKILSLLMDLKTKGFTFIIASHRPVRYKHLVNRILKITDQKLVEIKYEEIKGAPINNTGTILGKLIKVPKNTTDHFRMRGIIRQGRFQKSIDTTFPKQGLVLVTGNNGSGKTTLLMTIAGILSFKGTNNDFENHKTSLCYLPPLTYSFFMYPKISLEMESISQYIEYYPWIKPYLDLSPLELSMGYQKMLAMVIAFREFEIICIDEPSLALDTEMTAIFLRELEDLKTKLIVLSSNDTSFIQKVSSLVDFTIRL